MANKGCAGLQDVKKKGLCDRGRRLKDGGSRDCCCELLFGDGAVEDTLES